MLGLTRIPRRNTEVMNLNSRSNSLVDRVRGCLLAGAVGDAMGGPFEGKPGPMQFREHRNWKISDDSQLTLATCESISQLAEVSPEHIAGQFVRWFKEGRLTGLGASTLKALRDLDAGVQWALAGAKGEMAAGNGAAMRIAPLAFHLDPALLKDRQLIRDVCRITHHNEEAYAGALAVVAAIRSLAFDDSASPTQLLQIVVRDLPDSRVRDRIFEIGAISDERTVADLAVQFGSSGYVVESVPLALFAAHLIEQHSLESILRSAIEAGGDTDTVASITGQIAGVWIGASGIPKEFLDSLPNLSEIERIVEGFAATV